MGYTFISYGSNDRDIVNPIRDILVSNGIKTWIAPDDIPIGGNYSEVINEAINEAIKYCSLFVIVLIKVYKTTIEALKNNPLVKKRYTRFCET